MVPTNSETAPMTGPSVKPKAKAAPINAIPLVRFSVEVVSAMYAWAVEIVAPAIPAPIRDMNNQVRLCQSVANPNSV